MRIAIWVAQLNERQGQSQRVGSENPGLLADPGYDGRLGFLHLVHEDLGRVLDLVATESRPLVVFIDDLDRCSYSTVAQVIEGINAFLAGDFRLCIFVIAMEPELVAAQIHVAYRDLFDEIAARGSSSTAELSWRFLEKIVQLSLALPSPSPRPPLALPRPPLAEWSRHRRVCELIAGVRTRPRPEADARAVVRAKARIEEARGRRSLARERGSRPRSLGARFRRPEHRPRLSARSAGSLRRGLR